MKAKLPLLPVILAALVTSCAKEPQWREYVSEEGRFSIMVPGRVETMKLSIERSGGKIYEVHFFGARESLRYRSQSCSVMYVDMKPEDDSTFIQWFWNVASCNIQQGIYGEISEGRNVSIGGYSGKEFEYKDIRGGYTARIFQVKGRVYALVARITQARNTHGNRYQDHVFRFLDSFKLIE
ncbi:hypothetical protein JXM67_11845 [candidate division WOR-3 bacterium]|nr:hypothetical protein [candidate division WOR-3 bacterium]